MFYRFVRFLGLILCKVLFFIGHTGSQNVPETGGAVICPNHRSMWDGVLVVVTCRRPLSIIAKEELFKNKFMGLIFRNLNCYPVRRDGGDLAVAKTALSLLKKGEALLIFPEGERIRKGKKPNLKPGAFRLAMMAGVPVIPVGIEGDFRFFRKMNVHYGTAKETASLRGQRFTEEEYKEQIAVIMKTSYALAEGETCHD